MSAISTKYLQKKVALRYLFLLVTMLTSVGTSHGQSNCEAGFTYDMTYCPNIYFDDNSTADSTIVCWMFDYNGAGGIDMCEHAHNKFDTNGVYIVCISIMTIDGCTDQFCDSITITCVCDKPQPGFTMSQTGNACNFTDTSVLADIPNTTWLWDFGDGTSSTLEDPSHVYTANGTYMACLTVTDTCASEMICVPVVVTSVTTGLPEFEHSNVSIYPIPATDWIKVETENSNATMVELYTMSGRILIRERFLNPESAHFLRTTELANGQYYLRVSDAENNFSHHPIVIQH
ncbi:MAG: PKD repeat protein [Crocinitomicaceae bacterium]|jgi:PKD repeat protein